MQRVEDLAERDIERPERCREHPLVELAVVELEEDVPRRVVDRAVHRRDREQGGGDERGVRDLDAGGGLHVADQRAEADAHRREVEDRLEEARQHHHPARRACGDAGRAARRPGGCPPRARARRRRAGRSLPVRGSTGSPTGRGRSLGQPPLEDAAAEDVADGGEADEVGDVDEQHRSARSAARRSGTRPSSEACQSGETQPIHCSHSGSVASG